MLACRTVGGQDSLSVDCAEAEVTVAALAIVRFDASTHYGTPCKVHWSNYMKSFLRILMALSFISAAMVANAGEIPFTRAAFNELNAAGKTFVVHVASKSCTTCRVQGDIASKLLAEKSFEGVTLLKVDFDKEKELLKMLNVSTRSTFIVLKNGKELERMTGGTKKEAIANLLSKGR